MESQRPGVLQRITEKKTLDDALKAELKDALTDYAKAFAGATTAA